jgi:hypothetical protein
VSTNKKETNYEKCVLCHKLTDVSADCPIDAREYYVPGIGQLCNKCFGEIGRDMADESGLTDSQLNAIMRRCLQENDDNEYKPPSAFIQK